MPRCIKELRKISFQNGKLMICRVPVQVQEPKWLYEQQELAIVSFPRLTEVCKFGAVTCFSRLEPSLGRIVVPKVTRSGRFCLLVFWSQRSAGQSLHDLVQHLLIFCPRGHWTPYVDTNFLVKLILKLFTPFYTTIYMLASLTCLQSLWNVE